MYQMKKLPSFDSRPSLSKTIRDPNSFATTLLAITVDAFGVECFSWHPTALEHSLNQHFGAGIPDANIDRIWTAIAIKNTNGFFRDPKIFIPLANVLSGDTLDLDQFDPADVLECAWAVTESQLLHPPDKDEPELFSDEIRAYIAYMLTQEGLVRAPKCLAWVKHDLTQKVPLVFSQDLEFGAPALEFAIARAGEIDDAVSQGLSDLVSQLQNLKLEHADMSRLSERLHKFYAEERRRSND